MNRRTMAFGALAPVVATAAGIALGATPAGAGGPGEPMRGDIDGDGLEDIVTPYGDPSTGGCGVSVQLAVGWRQYGPPTAYGYALPNGVSGECPDMGAIVDLGGDGAVEILLAWFNGRPSGLDNDVMILRDFQPDGGFEAMAQPSTIRTIHLDGDGLLDVYQTTDQGEGLRTWLNTPSGEMVEGPLRFAFDTQDAPQWADVDEDGSLDAVISGSGWYDPATGGFVDGAVVVLDDGTVQWLARDTEVWRVTVVDADGDGDQDVKLEGRDYADLGTWLGNGDGTFVAPK